MADNLILALIVAAVTGGVSGVVSTFITVAALRVHISYLREGLKRVGENTRRAHQRIDNLEKSKT